MYEKLYHLMFNAATDALRELEDEDFRAARETLIRAQRRAEEEWLEQTEAGEGDGG